MRISSNGATDFSLCRNLRCGRRCCSRQLSTWPRSWEIWWSRLSSVERTSKTPGTCFPATAACSTASMLCSLRLQCCGTMRLGGSCSEPRGKPSPKQVVYWYLYPEIPTWPTERKQMKIHMARRTSLALIPVMCLLSTALLGQSPSPASASVKTYQLLPGLDKALIDTTADPCVDFFQYACGNFSKLYPIPADRSGFGTGAIIAEYTQHQLHAMLERAAAGGASRTPDEQKIGDYYASCMDTGAIDRDGLKPLQPELDRIAELKGVSGLTEL